MPLQIRRGTTAQRLTITPLSGELIYDTNTGQLFVGNGSTVGGATTTGISTEDAQDAAASLFSTGSHSGITFAYNDAAGRIDATVTVAATGPFDGDLTGSVFSDNSTLLVDGVDASLNLDGTIKGNVIPNTDSLIDLGSSSNKFNDLYLSESGSLYFGTSSYIAKVGSTLEFNTRLRIIDQQTTFPLTTYNSAHSGTSSDRSFIALTRSRGTYQSPTAIQNSDIINDIVYSAYDGSDFVGSAFIRGLVDPEGTIAPGIVPGKIELWTTGDDGVSRTRLVVDKSGRIISLGQLWAVTTVPTGLPIYALTNNNVSSAGSRVAMRRSRGTFDSPTTVQSGDNLFRLMWGGHDGTNYRDTASIEGNVTGTVSLGIIPSDLTIKTTSTAGALTTAAKFTTDQTLQIDKVSSLSGGSIDFQSRIDGDIAGSVFADDSTKIIDGIDGKITTPAITVSSFVKFPVYANPTARNAAIPNPEAGMVVFLTDSTGSGGSPKLQVNADSTTGGWVDLT
jgi:hypothetical protein